jgi:hypothetical protein
LLEIMPTWGVGSRDVISEDEALGCLGFGGHEGIDGLAGARLFHALIKLRVMDRSGHA